MNLASERRTRTTVATGADEFLRTQELSDLIKVPIGTIRNWRTRMYGPAGFKVGNTVLYRRSVVEAWLAEQERAETDRQASA